MSTKDINTNLQDFLNSYNFLNLDINRFLSDYKKNHKTPFDLTESDFFLDEKKKDEIFKNLKKIKENEKKFYILHNNIFDKDFEFFEEDINILKNFIFNKDKIIDFLWREINLRSKFFSENKNYFEQILEKK